MIISAVCSILIGFTFGQSIWLTLLISMIWGMSVISDYAQFSVAESEIAGVEYVGTVLTFQYIFYKSHPYYLENHWLGVVFTILAIGPIFGIMSMVKY